MFFFFSIFLSLPTAYGAGASDKTIDVVVEPDDGSHQIRLSWTHHTDAYKYRVYRRTNGVGAWDYLWAANGEQSTFQDEEAVLGVAYEYRVERDVADVGLAGTYVMAGHEVGPRDNPGLALVVVAEDAADKVSNGLDVWMSDAAAEGWTVRRLDLTGAEGPVEVKQAMIEVVAEEKNVAVLLVGHVPVPYSGLLVPDGHENHYGAWPADGYYGVHGGNWTDSWVNESRASRPENRNVPGDGKFDQSRWPADVEWRVGRVDFSRLPAFAETEAQLYQRYFEKNHAFRTGEWIVPHRALVDDNFGFFHGEAFASTAWSWSSLLGRDQIIKGDWIEDLSSERYLWAYGCGGGSYTSAGGIGSTDDFAVARNEAVFGALFGSYFGDWDSQDNLLRAALGTEGSLLTVAWSGRPVWFFHGMGLGEPIGDSVRRSQNTTVYAGVFARGVHMALMGDPTLTMFPTKGTANVTLSSQPGVLQVDWDELPEDAEGVFIYLREGEKWTRLNDSLLTESPHFEELEAGDHTVAVRPARLEFSPSGSFWNLGRMSTGTFTVEEAAPEDTGDSGHHDDDDDDVEASGCACNKARPNAAWLGLLALVALRWRRNRLWI